MKIDKVEWGKVWIDGEIYPQILIVDSKIYRRDEEKIRAAFGDTHQMTEDEKAKLLSGQPKIILIGNGFDGLFKVDADFQTKCCDKNIELIILPTPVSANKFNELQNQNITFNTLLHLTC